jgi:GLPGLI family protein
MKKLFTLLFVFFISNLIFCQSGKITYTVNVQLPEKEIPKKFEALMLQIIEYANNQKFELSFNQNLSSFKLNEQLAKNEQFDQKIEDLARSSFSTSSDVYLDHTYKKEIHKKPDGQLILNNYQEQNWIVTKESKTIDGNVCFKAILKIDFVNRKGESKTKETIAWFAPSLPFAYGPNNYFGLPGLILELTENKTTYYATKIELSQKEIAIDFPKGETVSRAQYNQKLKEQLGM